MPITSPPQVIRPATSRGSITVYACPTARPATSPSSGARTATAPAAESAPAAYARAARNPSPLTSSSVKSRIRPPTRQSRDNRLSTEPGAVHSQASRSLQVLLRGDSCTMR